MVQKYIEEIMITQEKVGSSRACDDRRVKTTSFHFAGAA
jgi:hypothetical protein